MVTEFSVIMQGFLDSLEGKYEPNTVIFYRSTLRPFGRFLNDQAIQLNSIRLSHIERHMAERKRSGVSQATRYHDATGIRKFLDWSKREGYIASNPLRIPRHEGGLHISKPEPPEGFTASKEQIDLFLRKVQERWTDANPNAKFAGDDDRLYRARIDYCVILLIKETGCRLGEACSLLWKDVRESNQEWEGSPTVTFRGTKTKKDRTVPVTGKWMTAYRKYLGTYFPENDKHEGIHIRDMLVPNGPLFVTPVGNPLRAHWMGQKFSDYSRYAGMPSGFTAQTLRDFKATEYCEAGNVHGGAALLGHSPKTMLKHYAKKRPKHLLKVWQATEEYNPIQRRKFSRA